MPTHGQLLRAQARSIAPVSLQRITGRQDVTLTASIQEVRPAPNRLEVDWRMIAPDGVSWEGEINTTGPERIHTRRQSLQGTGTKSGTTTFTWNLGDQGVEILVTMLAISPDVDQEQQGTFVPATAGSGGGGGGTSNGGGGGGGGTAPSSGGIEAGTLALGGAAILGLIAVRGQLR